MLDEATAFIVDESRTACGCLSSETTGQPSDFTVRQEFGRIYFAWKDQSFCEEGFQLTRNDGTNTEMTFASEYQVASSTACERNHQPSSVYDSLKTSNLIIGRSYEYCINAYYRNDILWSGNSAYLTSGKTCASLTAGWESRLEGHVVLGDASGSLGVPDVTIAWTLGALSGTATTDDDGMFVIHFLDSVLSNEYNSITLIPSKSSGTIQHTFAYNNKDIASHTMELQHLNFDHVVSLIDTTSVPFIGYVLVDNMLDISDDNCPTSNARVCVYDVDSQAPVGCDEVDSSGFFTLLVANGLDVYVEAMALVGNHTYRLDSSSTRIPTGMSSVMDFSSGVSRNVSYYHIDAELTSSAERVILLDTSSQVMQLQVAGGHCNRTMGTATVVPVYSLCPTWVYPIETNQFESLWNLPSVEYTVEFHSMVSEIDGLPFAQGQVLAYLAQTNEHVSSKRHLVTARQLHCYGAYFPSNFRCDLPVYLLAARCSTPYFLNPTCIFRKSVLIFAASSR